MIDLLWHDVHHALRSLRRSPGFLITAVSSLAICISIGTFIVAAVTLMLGTPKPFARADRLVDVFTNVRESPFQTSSYADYLDLRAQSTTFDDVAASGPVLGAVNTGAGTRLVIGEAASGNLFAMLGIQPALGRTILPRDQTPGADRVTVIAYGLWQRDFGGRRDIIGQMLHIRGRTYTIVGVAPSTLTSVNVFPAQFWIPLTSIGDVETMGITDYVPSPGNTPLERRGERWLFLKGRLQDGQTIEHARADLQTVMSRLEAQYPASNKGRRFSALPTLAVRIHPRADGAMVMGAGALTIVVGMLILVACANVTGLQLARGTARVREVGIRLALGASRARLICHLLTETLLVSAAGGAVAVALVWAVMRFASVIDLNTPIPITIEPRVTASPLWFAAAAALLGGIVAGLAPAFSATRAGQAALLRSQTSLGVARRRRWSLRDGVTVVQTAAAVLLLVVAALLTRSVIAAARISIGFSPSRVVAFNTGTASLGYDAARATRFYTDALDRIRSLPDVETASQAWRTPFDLTFAQDPILLPDRHTSNDQVIPTERTIVSPDYFATLGIPLVEGRNFTNADTNDRQRVAIVNQTMARRYWPDQTAIGRHFRLRTLDGPDYEIVGVSADHKVRTVGEAATPYIHYAQSQWTGEEWTILVKARAGAAVPIDAIRGVLVGLEPDIVFRATSMDAKVQTVLLPASAAAVGLSFAGLLAIVFAAIGLYGVVAFIVAQRTNEFGVRMALGALPRHVMAIVLRRGFVVVGIGTAIGALGAIAAARILARVLYGISPADPIAWLGALLVVTVVGALAHVIPARRAAAVDPVQALRAD